MDVGKRLDRLENLVLALAVKVRKMANEQSFTNLQNAVTELGQKLRAKHGDMVAAHDAADHGKFEAHAEHLDDLINQVQNLGHGGNYATKTGQSPVTAAGPSTGDLPQNRGPLAKGPPPGAQAQPKPGSEEHDVLVKGRDVDGSR